MGWFRDAIVDVFTRILQIISDVYNGIIRTFVNWFQTAVDSIIWLATTIGQIISDAIKFVLKFVYDVGVYLYNLFLGEEGFVWYIFDFALWLANYLLDMIPGVTEVLDRYHAAFDISLGLIGRLDQFIPLTEAYWLLSTYLAFKIGIIVIKFVMKFTPGMGG